MLNGYSIIDADSHVIEPPTMWAEYLEPEFKQFAPSPEMRIKGKDIVEKVSKQVRYEANKQMMQAHLILMLISRATMSSLTFKRWC